MSQTIRFPKKAVTWTDECKQIMEYLEEALKESAISLDELTAKDVQERGKGKSFLKVLGLIIENATGVNVIARKIELKEFQVDLEFFAEKVFGAYQDYLRDLLNTQRVPPSDVTSPEIKNKFVLIREILLRLAAQSLSTDNDKEEGDARLTVSKRFIEILKTKGVLNDAPWFFGWFGPTSPSNFGLNLDSQSNFIFTIMENSNEISTAVNAHKLAIRNCRDFVDLMKSITRAQILAYFFPNEVVNCSDSHEVDYLLRSHEKKLISGGAVSIQAVIQFVPHVRDYQGIKRRLCEHQGYLQQALMPRYELLQQLEDMSAIIQKIDFIIGMFGWLPVFTGVFKFDGFKDRLAELYASCQRVLVIGQEDPIVYRTSKMFNTLFTSSCLNTTALHIPQIQVVRNLNRMEAPELFSNLIRMAENEFRLLIDAQESAGIQLVDSDNLRIVREMLGYDRQPQLEGGQAAQNPPRLARNIGQGMLQRASSPPRQHGVRRGRDEAEEAVDANPTPLGRHRPNPNP